MIVNKKSLLVSKVADVDKKESDIIGNVVIRNDGTVIAANNKVRIAISPVNKEVKKNLILDETEFINDMVCISVNDVEKFISAIKNDTLLNGMLEHCDIEEKKFGVKCTIHTGNGNVTLEGKKYSKKYIDWKKDFQEIKKDKLVRGVFNLKRLINLLTVMEKISDDASGFFPVFVEFNEKQKKMILKCYNKKTGQTILACNAGYEYNEIIKESEWEKGICYE
jgi:hypothetical protein